MARWHIGLTAAFIFFLVLFVAGILVPARSAFADNHCNDPKTADWRCGFVPQCGEVYLTLSSKEGKTCPQTGRVPFSQYKEEWDNLCEVDAVDTQSCNFCDVLRVFVRVAHFLLASLGGVALIFFLWGGIGMIFNWGNEEKIAEAKKTLIGTLIGVFIVLLAWSLVNILVAILVTPAGEQPTGKVFNLWYEPVCGGKK